MSDQLSSRAAVTLPKPQRWAKQLVAHLGRKTPPEQTPEGTMLFFGDGQGIVSATDDQVVLVAQASSAESLAMVEDVLARHLVRFAQREGELTVEWSR